MSNIHPSEQALRTIPPLAALLAFERAASQLSFRRAARDLSLSPSAISHQIRGLEEQFGVKLFIRGARSVRLTSHTARPSLARQRPAMLEAAEQGLGVTLAMAPLIRARPGFGKKLVVPFDVEIRQSQTIYLVSRTEQARDRQIGALRRWIVEAVKRAS